ncbi:4943_t:CDS:2, partial [Funneliformis geosporum]
AENNERLTAIFDDAPFNRQEILFMAIDNEGAMVTLSDIPVFFDILVPDGKCPNECETKLSYEKKSYLQIYMSGTGKRKIAIKAIQENNFKTASDNLYSFHQK